MRTKSHNSMKKETHFLLVVNNNLTDREFAEKHL